LTPRGLERVDYWSVSLGQDAIGALHTVKRMFAPENQRLRHSPSSNRLS
jgi:hypothetical protein